MRMRNKPWARPELEACSWFIGEPEGKKGRWNQSFPANRPLYIELGCGKGGFAAAAATADPDRNYLAVDIEFKMLGVARRKIAAAYEALGKDPDNILISRFNIEKISDYFGEKDSASRIYINFCNPWPRKKHKKHRLTHPRQLEQYKNVLLPGGEIHFKTDDDELFEESIVYFKECGYDLKYITRDLHNSDYQGNIMTEHELMFSQEGIPIKFLIAVYPGPEAVKQ